MMTETVGEVGDASFLPRICCIKEFKDSALGSQ